jgi:hypothetical protein
VNSNKVVNKASDSSGNKQKSIVDDYLEKYGAIYYSDIITEDVSNGISEESKFAT